MRASRLDVSPSPESLAGKLGSLQVIGMENDLPKVDELGSVNLIEFTKSTDGPSGLFPPKAPSDKST